MRVCTPEILLPAAWRGPWVGAGRQESNNFGTVPKSRKITPLSVIIHELPNTALPYVPLALFGLIHFKCLFVYSDLGFSWVFSFNTDLFSSYYMSALSGDTTANKNRLQIFMLSWGERKTISLCNIFIGQP